MLTPELVAGTAAFVASCQTYEGGFASASQPSFGADAEAGSPRADYRPPLGEAHGGYTFCALGAWALLRPFTRALPAATRPRLRMRAVRRWLAAMQGGGADLGGFRGRTNKLVDGCYAWWVGGAFGLLGVLDVDRPDEGKAVLGASSGTGKAWPLDQRITSQCRSSIAVRVCKSTCCGPANMQAADCATSRQSMSFRQLKHSRAGTKCAQAS
jgi:protein farnesyltransferase subunit beta